MASFEQLQSAAKDALARGDAKEAAALLENTLLQFQESPALLDDLALAYGDLGQAPQASATLQRLVRALELRIARDGLGHAL